MSNVVKKAGKALALPFTAPTRIAREGGEAAGRESGLIPEVPAPYDPASDPLVQSQLAETNRARSEASAAQERLRAQQAEATRRLEAEQRELATRTSASARARRRGGARALLSSERLNPEIGLNASDALGTK